MDLWLYMTIKLLTDGNLYEYLIMICILLIFLHCAIALHNYHMLQLSSYKARAYRSGFLRDFRKYYSVSVFRKAKKPFVYTPRVKRMLVTHAIVMTLAGILSLAMRVERQIIFLSMLTVLTPAFVLLVNFLNSPLEKLINNWYISDAKRVLRGMPRLIVIGVTGSCGKTSTKYFLQRLLSSRFNVLMTPESYNTTMGVVRTIRTQLRPVHDVFVCEMGARHPGDIREICDIVEPRYGVITAIGPQHLESFGTLDSIIKTKFELADAVRANGGMIFLNCDSEIIRGKNYGGPHVSYAAYLQSPEADACGCAAGDIRVSSSGSSFRVRFQDGGERAFDTPLIGRHNVQNITAAIAVADYLGVERDSIAVSVRRLEAVPHRLQLIRRNSIIIIDDSYNSNQSGAAAALETLAMIEGVKILVTPGMVELGASEDEHNRRFGEQAGAVCDYVVLVGERQTKSILEGLKSASYPDEKIFVAKDLGQALGVVEKIDSGGVTKVVLLENDLPDNY